MVLKITEKGLNGVFALGLRPALGGILRLAQPENTNQETETYAGLGEVPALSKWDGGPIKTMKPGERSITVVNDVFQGGVQFSYDDVRRDKTSEIRNKVTGLGVRASNVPVKLIHDLIEGSANGYDAVPLFSNSHEGSQDNLLAPSASTPSAPTTQEMKDAIWTAIEEMMSIKDIHGEPLAANVRSFAVVTSPKMMGVTMEAIGALDISSTTNSLAQAIASGKISVEHMMDAYMTGTGTFYLFALDGPGKAFILQTEVDYSTDLIDEKKYRRYTYSAEWIGGAGLAWWQVASKSVFA
jgi:hypothetical protein